MANLLQDEPGLFAGHSPDQERPLRSYGALMGTFVTLASCFAGWFLTSGRDLPDRVQARDLLLLTVATHKIARLIAKDRVTSVVRAPLTRFEGNDGQAKSANRRVAAVCSARSANCS
jgi:hypothetical protein